MDFARVCVVIDALDECQASELCQSRFISEFESLKVDAAANLLATSRYIPTISSRFEICVSKDIHASDNGINAYLEGHMSRLPGFIARNPKLQLEVKRGIMVCVWMECEFPLRFGAYVGVCSIMRSVWTDQATRFLLAQLHLNSLQGERSPEAVRTALGTLAQGFITCDSAYRDAMDRICSQLPDQKELALQTLSWLTHEKRPMQSNSPLDMLAIDSGDNRIDEENITDLHDVLSNCCGLATVDKDSNIIRLAHFTALEFLARNRNIWLPDDKAVIDQTCLMFFPSSVNRCRLLGPRSDVSSCVLFPCARKLASSTQTYYNEMSTKYHTKSAY